jgi:hypothetical protein
MTGTAFCLFGDKFMHFLNEIKHKYRSFIYGIEKK